jgi:hypothetical protein
MATWRGRPAGCTFCSSQAKYGTTPTRRASCVRGHMRCQPYHAQRCATDCRNTAAHSPVLIGVVATIADQFSVSISVRRCSKPDLETSGMRLAPGSTRAPHRAISPTMRAMVQRLSRPMPLPTGCRGPSATGALQPAELTKREAVQQERQRYTERGNQHQRKRRDRIWPGRRPAGVRQRI